MEPNYSIYIVLIWLLVANLLGFILMGADKQRARNRSWRISEQKLLLVAFLGGGVGSIAGMLLFHHKTKHMKFILLVPIAIILNLTAAGLILRLL